MLLLSKIIPIAKDPKTAQIPTITAIAIIPFGNSLAGFLILCTYGDIDSAPPTEKTRSAIVVKYEKSNFGIYVSILSIFAVASCRSGLINGTPTANRMNKIDITNIAVPAIIPKNFNARIPFVEI